MSRDELLAEKDKILTAREPLKEEVEYWQSQLGAWGGYRGAVPKRAAIKKIDKAQRKLREYRDRLREINRDLVELEERKKREAHASFADFFLQVVRDAVPRDKFEGWMTIAGRRFRKHYELVDE